MMLDQNMKGENMRKGDVREIVIGEHFGDQLKIRATFLGAGRYCRAFLNEVDRAVYLYVQGCYMKEVLEDLNGPHIPKIERINVQTNRRTGDDVYVYKTQYYETLTPKHKQAWAQFRELQKTADTVRTETINALGYGRTREIIYEGYKMMHEVIERANVPEELKNDLRELADAAANYGSSVTFEFAKRNLGVTKDGVLILRDILFDQEKIKREYAEKRRKACGY